MKKFSINLFKYVSHEVIYTSLVFLFFSTVTRLILLFKEFPLVSLLSFVPILVKGFFADLCPLFFIISFFLFINYLIPKRISSLVIVSIVKKISFYTFIVFMIFSSIAEYLFWNEFTSRFNFIAVDYLVYTNEVLKNIIESYPMGVIISSIFFLAALVFILVLKIKLPINSVKMNFKQRLSAIAVCLLMTVGYYFLYSKVLDQDEMDNLSKQLSSNGVYRFVEAFKNNEIDYPSFYRILPEKFVRQKIENEFLEHAQYSKDLGANTKLFKKIVKQGAEKKYNVVYILIESLGGKYIGALGNKENITPFLDQLSEKSLFLSRLFSTGTRTVRGIEATVLSIPPTPGYSIVKRPNNEKLNSMGSVFHKKGYDLKFIYGGNGYFDNMNYFFSNNYFHTIDRSSFKDSEVHFENAWGVCDEDLFSKSLSEADKSYAANEPFLQFLLTTSNHRPFTYPDGKIDIPSKTGRSGAVKYTDYAIGKFLEVAQKKPWFSNTIFVLVADHSTEGRGTFDLVMNDFHIPAWIYAPGILKPRKISQVISQTDILPTILGLLNFSYESYFFGNDILAPGFDTDVYIGNYQHLGFYEEGHLVTLGPKRVIKNYTFEPESMTQTPTTVEIKDITEEAISFYQYASNLWKSGFMKEDVL